MKPLEFTKSEKIAILKDAIEFLKCHNIGMCQAIGYGVDVIMLNNQINRSDVVGVFNIEYTFPSITHRNYVLFYPLSWNVYKHRKEVYWDKHPRHANKLAKLRRVIFLYYILIRTIFSR